MLQEVKDKWLAALRSGEYEQGTQMLCSIENQFCCLGVITDLYIKEHEGEAWEINSSTFKNFYGNSTYLIPKVMDWTNLKEFNPSIVLESGERKTLSDLNDKGYTFSEIADLIERYL